METILWVFFRAVASAELLANDLEDFQTAREEVDELLKSKNPSSVEDVVSIVDAYRNYARKPMPLGMG